MPWPFPSKGYLGSHIVSSPGAPPEATPPAIRGAHCFRFPFLVLADCFSLCRSRQPSLHASRAAVPHPANPEVLRRALIRPGCNRTRLFRSLRLSLSRAPACARTCRFRPTTASSPSVRPPYCAICAPRRCGSSSSSSSSSAPYAPSSRPCSTATLAPRPRPPVLHTRRPPDKLDSLAP